MNALVFSLFGILAPLFYIVPTIIGGKLRYGYNHITNSVSDLLVSGAPYKRYLVIPFTFYPVFLSIFGFGIYSLLSSAQQPLSSPLGLSGFILIGSGMGVLGILTMTVFPQDEQGTRMTIPGLLHLVLVGIQAVSAMAAILLIGLWFNSNGYTGYFIYSIISLAVLIATGIMSMVGAKRGSSYMGLFERLNVSAIVQWLVVIGIWLSNLEV